MSAPTFADGEVPTAAKLNTAFSSKLDVSGSPTPNPVTSVFGRLGAILAAVGDYLASQINNDSAAAGATVKDALNGLNTSKAPLASPALTGTPTTTTPLATDSSTAIANTSWVKNSAVGSIFGRVGAVVSAFGDYLASQISNDSGVPGVDLRAALNSLNTNKAPLISPALTGTPTGTTPPTNDNSTALATTAWVKLQSYTTVVPNSNLPQNVQTGTAYMLALTDRFSDVRMNNAAANAVTVPLNATVPFSIGDWLIITQLGAGQTSVTPAAGVTINKTSTLNARVQYAKMFLEKVGTDTWELGGETA